MQTRQCWTVLANKAQDECDRLQQELQNIQQRLQGLQANERRLRQLYAEYHERLTRPGAEMSGMQDAIHHRQFMQQIAGLIDKVLQDQSITQQALKLTRERTVQAQREKLKMQALVEQDQQRQRAALNKKEQQQMDEAGLRQFQMRRLTGHA